MIAPLFDNRGVARYYIGCQIDVTNLLDRGRALDSFRQLLDEDLARLHKHQSHRMTASKSQLRRDALRELTKLSSLLNNEEVEAINSGIKSRTAISDDSRSFAGTVNSRRVIGMDDVIDKSMWPAPQYGPSGRLPGVYQNVRPISSENS